ncbi:aspartate aminotransferase family protein, partial [Acinetobacter baumannii]
EPAPDLAQATLEEARRRGLILLKAGMYGNVIRILVPLSALEEEVLEGVSRLEASLEVVLQGS